MCFLLKINRCENKIKKITVIHIFAGTLTRRHSRRKSNSTDDSSNSGTLKRQHSYKSRGSLDSMGGRSGSSTPHSGTPVRERASPFGERERSSPFSDRPPSANSLRSPMTPNGGMMDMPSSMVSWMHDTFFRAYYILRIIGLVYPKKQIFILNFIIREKII